MDSIKNKILFEIKELLELGLYNINLISYSPSAEEDGFKIDAFLKSNKLQQLDSVLNPICGSCPECGSNDTKLADDTPFKCLDCGHVFLE